MTRELQDNETMGTMGQQDKGSMRLQDDKRHNYEKWRTTKISTTTQL